jgi:hypothetical protein
VGLHRLPLHHQAHVSQDPAARKSLEYLEFSWHTLKKLKLISGKSEKYEIPTKYT